jgi:hypothetical protein
MRSNTKLAKISWRRGEEIGKVNKLNNLFKEFISHI